MSITRSSIPVCINCSALCASRRVPPLCVTAAHSSLVPLAIVRDVARLVPERVSLLRATVSPAGPPSGRSLGQPALGYPCTQLLEKPLSTLFPFPTSFFPVLFSFSMLCFPLLCFALLDSFLPFPHQFLLTQGEFQRQVAFAVLLYLKMVDKTPSLDASEATRHPKVSSTFLEEEHHHHLEQKVRTLGFELGGV